MTKEEIFTLIEEKVEGLRAKAILKDAIEDLLMPFQEPYSMHLKNIRHLSMCIEEQKGMIEMLQQMLKWKTKSNPGCLVYISGKVSGIEEKARVLFARAEKELKLKGYNPINPMNLPHCHDKSWHNYMREDIKALCECDAIYMLSNWTDSKGAIIEHRIALYLGLQVYYCPNLPPLL